MNTPLDPQDPQDAGHDLPKTPAQPAGPTPSFGPPTQPASANPPSPGQEPALSTLAVVTLVLSIVAVPLYCAFGLGILLAVAAVVCGIIALNNISASAGALRGRGLAIGGLITSGVGFLLIPVLALMIGILLPALGAARRTARQMQSNTQIRGIHQAHVMFAHSNNRNFPGLTSAGELELNALEPSGPHGGHPALRFQLLLEANYFTGEYLLSPVESGLSEWTGGPLQEDQYSFAALRIAENNTSRNTWHPDVVGEWSETLNTFAPVLGDRNTGIDPDLSVSSIHTELDSGDWRGSVTYNDNHVVFETSEILDTEFSGSALNDTNNGTGDSLFLPDDGAAPTANAAWVYSDAITTQDQNTTPGPADNSPD
ncbi:MAG: DUF4190 domain-containing protein [Planctomycetota bacterium]